MDELGQLRVQVGGMRLISRCGVGGGQPALVRAEHVPIAADNELTIRGN